MVLSDDMRTPQGIVEGTAGSFANSWKANLMCSDAEERLDDPCSLSIENGKLLFIHLLCTSTIESQKINKMTHVFQSCMPNTGVPCSEVQKVNSHRAIQWWTLKHSTR